MPHRESGPSLLAACLDGRPEKLVGFPGRDEAAWEGLISAAAAEFVLPALSHRLAEIGVEPPREIADFLSAVEELNGERNTQIVEEMRAIGQMLNFIGIEPVALKGAAFLLAGVYPKQGCRYLCDLDLLVPEHELKAAASVLEQNGYKADTRDAMGRFRHHYPQLQKPRVEDGSGSAPVELHHALGHGVSRRLLTGEEVLRSSTVHEWKGVRIRLPSNQHLATHLILHSQLHHCYSERVWPPLRAMYDLAMLDRHFRSRLPWDEIRAHFRSRGQHSTLLLHLLQVHATLGMPLPFEIEPGWLVRARWLRRRALRRWPALRYGDPVYIAMATLSRRVQFLQSIASAPGGWQHAARTLFRPGFYRRLLAELVLR